MTGTRLSELLGLTWADVALADLDAAEIRISFQVDRQGNRQALKTDESQRAVEIPPQLAAMLAPHKLNSPHVGSAAVVFATRSGRALGQRNVVRALRHAQTRAIDAKGRPTFSILHERYVQEIRTAERKSKRRAKMTARYGSALEALDRSTPQQAASTKDGDVRQLRG